MAANILQLRLKNACTDLHNAKAKTKKESVDIICSLLDEEGILSVLTAEDWNFAFTSVKALLYKELRKIDDEIAKKGKENPRSSCFIHECTSLLNKIVETANCKNGLITYSHYIQYLNDCKKPSFKKYCLDSCLNGYKDGIITKDIYLYQLGLEELLETLTFLKDQHFQEPSSNALNTYILLLKRGADYKLPIKFVKEEMAFMRQIVKSVTTSDNRSLLESAAHLSLVVCEICAGSYAQMCLNEGEAALLHLFKFYSPVNNITVFRKILMELVALQLKYHENISASEIWTTVLLRTGYFVKKSLERNDSVAITTRSNVMHLDPHFITVAVECYKQSIDAGITNSTISSEQQCSKRARLDTSFIETIQHMQNNINAPWIVIFTRICEKYPQLISEAYFNTLLITFSNYVKDSKSIILRGYVFTCLRVLLQVEEYLVKKNADFVVNNSEWLQVYDSTIRTTGLNQNPSESHELLQEILIKKQHIITQSDASKLLSLYSCNTIPISVTSLMTINTFGSTCVATELNELTFKTSLIDSILLLHVTYKERNFKYFSDSITADVLVNLTFKYWTNTSLLPSTQQIGIVNPDAYNHLISSLNIIIQDVLKVEGSNYEMLLSGMNLLANLIYIYKTNNIIICSDQIEEILKSLTCSTWKSIQHILENLDLVNVSKVEAVLELLHVVFKTDEKIGNVIKISIDFPFIKSLVYYQYELASNSSEANETDVQLKLLISKILTAFAYRIDTNAQKTVQEMLYLFEDFNPDDKIEYSQAMIILHGLENQNCILTAESVDSILSLVQRICNHCHYAYDSCLEILQILKYIFWHLVHTDDLNEETQESYFKIFKTLHRMRINFGWKFKLNLIDCIACLISSKRPLTWAMCDDELLLMLLPKYLKTDCLQVQNEAVKVIVNVFKTHESNVMLIDRLKSDLFAKVLQILDSQIPTEDGDELNNFHLVVLNFFSSIIVAAKGTKFTKLSLCEMVLRAKKYRISNEQLKSTIDEIKLREPQFEVGNYLNFLLHAWTKQHSLIEFPELIFGFTSKKDFYLENISFLSLLVLQHDSEEFDMICNETGKSPSEILEQCYPNFIARNIILQASPDDIKNQNTSTNTSFSVPQLKMDTLLASDKRKQITRKYLDSILTEILKYVYDPHHFEQFFEFNICTSKPEGNYISHEIFCNDVLDLLSADINADVVKYLYEKKSNMLQRILLNLKYNIWKKLNIEDKVLEFYRYALFMERILVNKLKNNEFITFIIRDVIYTIINLTKHEQTIIQTLALRFLGKFIDLVLPNYSKYFAEFIIVTCSSLVQNVTRGDIDALKVLKKIIFSEDQYIKNNLQHLDPLPRNNEHVKELREHHMNFRKQDNSLEEEIELFLVGKQFKDCRTEGLKYLGERLKVDVEGLRTIYLKLQNMRGILSENSKLHSLICTLVSLVNSKDDEESIEAVKCLGILGAGDLTTMVLQSEDVIQTKEGSSYQFTVKIINLLIDYLIDENQEFAKYASEALYVVLASKEGNKAITNETFFTNIRGYFLPFISSTNADQSLLSVKEVLYTETLKDSNLWCPESQSHEKWIIRLVTKILQGFDNQAYIKCLIPIISHKSLFAEDCFPYLLNLLMDTSARVKRMLGVCIKTFFEDHWNSRQHNITNSITMNKTSIKCVLNAIHFIRLQRLCDKKGYYKELELDLNYLHIAYAAQYCSAHFSALMYAEKWYQCMLRDKQVPTINNFQCLFSSNEISDIDEELKVLRSILTQAYNDIGDSYALYGGHLENDQKVYASSFNLNNNLDHLLHCDIKMFSTTENANLMTKALKDHALYNLAVKTATYGDAYYESMWRLSQWNITDSTQNSNDFEFNIYNLLNTLNDENRSSFDSLIHKSRLQISASLKNISLESCKTLYGPLSALERLQELQDIFNVASSEDDLLLLINKFMLKDKVRTEFEYYEPRVAQRIEAIGLLQKRGYHGAKDIHTELRLNLADISREHGNLLISKRLLSTLDNIDYPEIKAKVQLMKAQLEWQLGHTSGITCLKNLLKNYDSNTRLRSNILKLCGEWMSEKQNEFPHKILSKYFIPSIEILNQLDSNDQNTIELLNEAYKALAKFADDQYQTINKSIKSPEFECKIKAKEKFKAAALKLRAVRHPGDDIKRAALTYERFMKIDEMDIKAKYKERDTFLNVAMKYYLFHIKYTKNVSTEIFRIFSLWLDNKSEEVLSNEIEQSLLKVESYKIIPILPQLIPHISTEQDKFGKCITKLIGKCAAQHPHHAIPMIQALANTNNDDMHSKNKTKTCTNESRINGAKQLIVMLQKIPNLKKIIDQNENLSSAFIELAYYKDPHSLQCAKIPRSLKLHSIKNVTEALLPTYTLPVRTNLNYSDIVGIHKFKPEFTMVGGINAPKRIECIGTDGISRLQLVKGMDDLRQDAVMQQVFVIMNELLKANRETENLQIRTYKVVPLSKRSGVLEWVNNTMPIGMYLSDAHKHYYPMDMLPENAKKEINAASNTQPNERLTRFNDICKRIRPVFHKFFETNFLEPTIWYEKRRAYTQSVATSSMCGYVLGIGDRHVQNILIDKTTADVIHIDFGIAFEQGRILPTPETVPFRLTRDIIDGLGISGVEGTFRKTCEKTMEVLRRNMITIQTILEVLLYDPLYVWSISTTQAYSKQMDQQTESQIFGDDDDETEINVSAERALTRLRHKLQGTEFSNRSTVESQVERLIQEARAPSNLSKLFHGWQAFL